MPIHHQQCCIIRVGYLPSQRRATPSNWVTMVVCRSSAKEGSARGGRMCRVRERAENRPPPLPPYQLSAGKRSRARSELAAAARRARPCRTAVRTVRGTHTRYTQRSDTVRAPQQPATCPPTSEGLLCFFWSRL